MDQPDETIHQRVRLKIMVALRTLPERDKMEFTQMKAVVGATDPFRNDRLDEHDNSAFAAGLLAARPRLVWLDLHERYEPPTAPRPTS